MRAETPPSTVSLPPTGGRGGADSAAAGPILVPGGAALADAAFARAGADLVIVLPSGARLLVEGYFAQAHPPALVSDGGLLLPPDLVAALAGPGAVQVAQLGGGVLASAGGEPIGKVETATGVVQATRADGSRVALAKGAAVFQGDVIETGAKSAVGIVFNDQTTFSLGDGARLVLDRHVFDPASKQGAATISVLKGVFMFVSGEIAHNNPDQMLVRTPVATIGIRGTKVAGVAAAEGDHNTFTLLPQEDGRVGEISVTTQSGTVTLAQANQTTQVASAFLQPTAPAVLPTSVVQSLFGGVTQTLPGLGGAARPSGGDSSGAGHDSTQGGGGADAQGAGTGGGQPAGRAPAESGGAPAGPGEAAAPAEGPAPSVEAAAAQAGAAAFAQAVLQGQSLEDAGTLGRLAATEAATAAIAAGLGTGPGLSAGMGAALGLPAGFLGAGVGGPELAAGPVAGDAQAVGPLGYDLAATDPIAGTIVAGPAPTFTPGGAPLGAPGPADLSFYDGSLAALGDAFGGLLEGSFLGGPLATDFGGPFGDPFGGGPDGGFGGDDPGEFFFPPPPDSTATATDSFAVFGSLAGVQVGGFDDDLFLVGRFDGPTVIVDPGGAFDILFLVGDAGPSMVPDVLVPQLRGGRLVFLLDPVDGGAENRATIEGGLGSIEFVALDGIAGLFVPVLGVGGADDDLVFTTSGAGDSLFGGLGDDLLFGSPSHDTLTGGAGDDELVGGLGNDRLQGDDGFDRLVGGLGNDTLEGGADDDTYAFAAHAGTDMIVDSGGIDVVELAGDTDAPTLTRSGGSLQATFRDGSLLTVLDHFGSGPVEFVNVLGDDPFLAILHTGLAGTTESDIIVGLASDDSIAGGTGNDLLAGGAGNDLLSGDDGDDILQGGAGDDTLSGGAGDDTADYLGASGGVAVDLGAAGPQTVGGGQGVDTLSGIERLRGSNFFDFLSGGAGNDELIGAGGDDSLAGGAGDDRYVWAVGDGSDLIDDSAGQDTLSLERDTRVIGGERVRLLPTDVTITRAASSLEIAYDGSPTGRVVVAGHLAGTPIERVEFEDLGGGGFSFAAAGTAFDDLIVLGASAASTEADTIAAGDGDDAVYGNGGDDVLFGEGGDDFLIGGFDDDTLDGGLGNDALLGGTGADHLIGGDGDDVLDGDGGGDALEGGDGNDRYEVDGSDPTLIVDAAGFDILQTASGTSLLDARQIGGADLELTLSTGVVTILSHFAGAPVELLKLDGNEGVVLTIGDGTIGTAHDDLLVGGDNFEVLIGGLGDDTLFGGAGDDLLVGDAGDNLLIGDGSGVTPGFDMVDYVDAPGGVVVNLGSGIVSVNGFGGVDTLVGIEGVFGSTHGDSLIGGSGDEFFAPDAGPDVVIGGAGQDFVSYATLLTGIDLDLAAGTADDGIDTDTLSGIEGAEGTLFDDLLAGDAGINVLKGLAGDDILAGEGGDDTLSGGGGDDVLIGGAGRDRLEGGFGLNTFAFLAPGDGEAVASNVTAATASAAGDDILDFFSGLDSIEILLSAFDSSATLSPGALTDAEFTVLNVAYDGTNVNAGTTLSGTRAAWDAGDDSFVFDTVTNQLYYDPDGAAPGYTVLAQLDASATLAAADVQLV